MSDVNCVILPDLEEGGTVDGTAQEHGTPVSGLSPLSRRFELLEQRPSGNEAICPWEENEPL